jgi:hypothetical protein
MSRGTQTFKQIDLTRALRAAKAAGIEVTRIELDAVSGKIVITTGAAAKGAVCDLDKWLAQHAG